MAKIRPEYELTEAADEDLLGIVREQARRYETLLENHFKDIGQGKTRTRIFSRKRPELLYTHCEHHYVFYFMREDDCPLIIAVLHEKMQLGAQIKNRLGN